MLRFELIIYNQTPIPIPVIGIITAYTLKMPTKRAVHQELLNRFEWCEDCKQGGHWEFMGTPKTKALFYCKMQNPWYKRCSYPFVKHQWHAKQTELFNEIRRLRSEIWPTKQGEWEPLLSLATPPCEEKKQKYWHVVYKLRLELYELSSTWWGDLPELARNWN